MLLWIAGVKAIQWGIEMESTAIAAFEQHTNKHVKQTGLWLHQSGILGASPDGLLLEENAVVEVKCPYSCRAKSFAEAKHTLPFLCVDKIDPSVVSVNVKHDYYHQIQGQLYITGTSKCYFLILTTDLAIIEVDRSSSWEANFLILIDFYYNKMLPMLLEGGL